MDSCHLKQAELAKFYQKYKGRVVFGENNVEFHDGYKAVLTKAGT